MDPRQQELEPMVTLMDGSESQTPAKITTEQNKNLAGGLPPDGDGTGLLPSHSVTPLNLEGLLGRALAGEKHGQRGVRSLVRLVAVDLPLGTVRRQDNLTGSLRLNFSPEVSRTYTLSSVVLKWETNGEALLGRGRFARRESIGSFLMILVGGRDTTSANTSQRSSPTGATISNPENGSVTVRRATKAELARLEKHKG
jgi:hypothetical protein